jgi:hypothetical protein
MNNTFEDGPDAFSGCYCQHPAAHVRCGQIRPYVADFDMSEKQKQELLETLWAIMQTFVNLGFDLSKADLCGQLFADFNEASEAEPDGVESFSSTQETAKQHRKDGNS